MVLTSSPFNNMDNATMSDGFWFIQKFTRGKSVDIVKIRDDPIQIANNKSRIIDMAYRLMQTSKLSSYNGICISGFINWGLRWIILAKGTSSCFQNWFPWFVISLRPIIERYPLYIILLGCTSITGHDVIDMGSKESLS